MLVSRRAVATATSALSLAFFAVGGLSAAAPAVADIVPPDFSYSAPDLELNASLIKDINPGWFAGAVDPRGAVLGSSLIFPGDDGIHGSEIWATDGTSAGTFMLKDIYPGSTGSAPVDIASVGPYVLFNALDPDNGRELWITDGTPAGTQLLKVLNPEINPPENAYGFTPFGNGRAFFVGWDSDHGSELWTTDGTASGTQLVLDILPGPQGSYPASMIELNGSLIFDADDGTGETLWKTDGTAQGTTKIGGPQTFAVNSSDVTFAKVNNAVIVYGTDGVHGNEYWRTDGTSAGTYQIADINPNEGDGACGWPSQVVVSGSLLIPGNDGVHGCELWATDGTSKGTRMVADLTGDSSDSWPGNFGNFGNGAAFMATTPSTGYEYWVTDGTTSGTRLVVDLNPGPEMGAMGGAVFTSRDFAQRIFFVGSESGGASVGYQTGLYLSDGTAAGTAKFMPGASFGSFLYPVGNSVIVAISNNNDITNQNGTSVGMEWWLLRERPLNTASPSISDGSVAVAALSTRAKPTPPPPSATTYTANPGTWSAKTSTVINYAYQWYTCSEAVPAAVTSVPTTCQSISGATSSSYAPDSGTTVGPYLTVAVTGSIPGGLSRTVWSPSLTVLTAPTAPGAVANLIVVPGTKGRAAVSWTAAAANGSPVTAYEYQLGLATVSPGAKWRTNNTSTSLSLTGLKPGAPYWLQVRARNAIGTGPVTTVTWSQP